MPQQIIIDASDSEADAGKSNVGVGNPLFVTIDAGVAKVLGWGLLRASENWTFAVVHPTDASTVVRARQLGAELYWLWHGPGEPPIIEGVRPPRRFHHEPGCPEWVKLEMLLEKIGYGKAAGDVDVKDEWNGLVACFLGSKIAEAAVVFLNTCQEELWVAERSEELEERALAKVMAQMPPLQAAMSELSGGGVPTQLIDTIRVVRDNFKRLSAWRGNVSQGYEISRSLRDSLFGGEDDGSTGLLPTLLRMRE